MKPANLKSWIFGGLLILPLIYIAVCWGIGMVYHRRPSVFGPYELQVSIDFRDAMKTGHMYWSVCDDGCKERDIKRKKLLEKSGWLRDKAVDYAYEKQPITFIYPSFEFVSFPNKWSIDQMGDGNYRETRSLKKGLITVVIIE